MAEVLGVIGSLGALVNIIDGTGKAISAISDLRTQWKDADLTLRGLSAQLTTFEAALRRIHEWLDSEPPESHHQLVLDLDKALVFCDDLISRLRELFAEWESLMGRPTAASSRWKVISGRKGINNLLVLVGHQTNALTLLLTACNCKSPTEQKQLLERPKSRKVFQRANVISASLLSQRDAASARTSWTDNWSKISVVFDFDTDVFSSRVYTRAFRDLSKYRIRIHEERGWIMLKRKESAPDTLHDIGSNVLMEACSPPSTYRSYVSAQEYPEPFTTTLSLSEDISPFQDNWGIMESAVERMFEDYAKFTIILAKQIPKLQSKHHLPNLPSLLGLQETSSDLSKVEKFWKHQDFGHLLQSVLSSGHYTTRQNGANPETIAQLFFHQLKTIGGCRLPDQISTCTQSLNSAYAHSKILNSTEDGASMALQAFLTWSKGPVKLEEIWSNIPFPRNTHIDINILTVTISVRMRNYLHNHTIPDLTELMNGRMNSWISTAKERKPDKIVLLLLVQGIEYFLPWAVDASASVSPTDEAHTVYEHIMEVFQGFGGIQTSFSNEYLMVWDSPQSDENLLGSLAEEIPPSDRLKRQDTLVSVRD